MKKRTFLAIILAVLVIVSVAYGAVLFTESAKLIDIGELDALALIVTLPVLMIMVICGSVLAVFSIIISATSLKDAVGKEKIVNVTTIIICALACIWHAFSILYFVLN